MKNLEEALEELKRIKAKKVFVQFGEGLKNKLEEINDFLNKRGIEAIFCLENTYGACDVREYEASLLKCDAILHLGHSDFGIKTKLPTIYVDWFIDADPVPALEKYFKVIERFERIGLVCSINFYPAMEKAKEWLTKKGKKIIVKKKEKYEGQVLGCRIDSSFLDCDCILCISSGKFYALGVCLNTEKEVFNLDLEKGEIYSMEKEKIKYKKIYEWNKQEFFNSKKVGILVSFKRGQLTLPYKIKEILEKKFNKKAIILAMDEITREKILGLDLDFLINTACPRIFPDDWERFGLPILNFKDLINIDKNEKGASYNNF